jgi:Uma2 family endonuclease
MYQRLDYGPDGPLPPSKTLPTMYDLPSECAEDPGLPDEFHDFQPDLLRETCRPTAIDIFVGADLNLYYDALHPQWYKRPDWFLVLDKAASTNQEELRWSYVMWQEGVAPFLVVELLSPGTEQEDLGKTLREVNRPPTKWQTYEQVLRVPFYVVFDRYEKVLKLFGLERGRYQEVALEGERFWFEALGLGLGVWEGVYQGVQGRWLRWYDGAENWVATQAERAEAEASRADRAEGDWVTERDRADAERDRADAERDRANAERDRAEQLAARLRELGIEE